MRTIYNRIKHEGEWLSASEIARRSGLSIPTVLSRHARGMTGRELVAPPGSLPRAADGQKFVYRSRRIPSPAQARYRLARAKAGLSLAVERLAHARAMGERPRTLARLLKEVARAEARRFYATEMVRAAEERKEAA